MLRYEVRQRTGDSVVLALEGEMVGDLPIDRLHDALKDHYVDDGVSRILSNSRTSASLPWKGSGCWWISGESPAGGERSSQSNTPNSR